jgi:RNA polymerase sigma-70 factor (ECF subfamily)
LTDRELLERYLAGDVSAFAELIDRHEKPLVRFAARYRHGTSFDGGREWAEDIVQETFLRLLRESRSLDGVQNLSAWLDRVARNLAIDTNRKEMRMERRHRLAAAAELQPAAPCSEEAREVGEIVARKLLGLPPNQRDVLILKIQEGKSYREISEITGLSASNVGYLIHHGLKKLAGELRTAGIV